MNPEMMELFKALVLRSVEATEQEIKSMLIVMELINCTKERYESTTDRSTG